MKISNKRNDSDEYYIVLNNNKKLECEVSYESRSEKSFLQEIKSTFKASERIEIKLMELFDKKTNILVGQRLLPCSVAMKSEDNMTITWIIGVR